MDPLIELTDVAKARIKTKEAKAAEKYDIVRRASAADVATAYRTWGGYNDLHQDKVQNAVDGSRRDLDEAAWLCGGFVFTAHATEYSAVLSIPTDLRPVLSNLRESVVKMYGEGARYSIQRLEAAEMEKAEHRHVPIDNRPPRREATLGESSLRNPRRSAEKPLKRAVRRPILPLTVLEAIGEIEERTKRLLEGCRTGISLSEEKATPILRACAVEAFDKKATYCEFMDGARRLQCLAAEVEPTITATLDILGLFDLAGEPGRRVEQQIRRALKAELKVRKSLLQSGAGRSDRKIANDLVRMPAVGAQQRQPELTTAQTKSLARIPLSDELKNAEAQTAEPKLQKKAAAVVRYMRYFDDLRVLKAACRRYQTPTLLEQQFPQLDIWAVLDNADKTDIARGDFVPGAFAWALVRRFLNLTGKDDRTLKNYRKALKAAGLL